MWTFRKLLTILWNGKLRKDSPIRHMENWRNGSHLSAPRLYTLRRQRNFTKFWTTATLKFNRSSSRQILQQLWPSPTLSPTPIWWIGMPPSATVSTQASPQPTHAATCGERRLTRWGRGLYTVTLVRFIEFLCWFRKWIHPLQTLPSFWNIANLDQKNRHSRKLWSDKEMHMESSKMNFLTGNTSPDGHAWLQRWVECLCQWAY